MRFITNMGAAFTQWARTKVFCQAVSDRSLPAAYPAAHCRQDHRAGAGASAGATAGSDNGLRRSQRARKKIEELWGEAKCWHGFRRFQRRGLVQVRDEAYLMGWLLNLKRLAKLLPVPALREHRGAANA